MAIYFESLPCDCNGVRRNLDTEHPRLPADQRQRVFTLDTAKINDTFVLHVAEQIVAVLQRENCVAWRINEAIEVALGVLEGIQIGLLGFGSAAHNFFLFPLFYMSGCA